MLQRIAKIYLYLFYNVDRISTLIEIIFSLTDGFDRSMFHSSHQISSTDLVQVSVEPKTVARGQRSIHATDQITSADAVQVSFTTTIRFP